jgi:hypothetical protein
LLIKEKGLGKTIENKDRLFQLKVISNDHKYIILKKTPSLKWSIIFINEDLILEDQVELRKEFQKVKESRKEGKWEIIYN